MAAMVDLSLYYFPYAATLAGSITVDVGRLADAYECKRIYVCLAQRSSLAVCVNEGTLIESLRVQYEYDNIREKHIGS